MQCKYCGKEFKNRKHKKVDGKWLDQVYCNIECFSFISHKNTMDELIPI